MDVPEGEVEIAVYVNDRHGCAAIGIDISGGHGVLIGDWRQAVNMAESIAQAGRLLAKVDGISYNDFSAFRVATADQTESRMSEVINSLNTGASE